MVIEINDWVQVKSLKNLYFKGILKKEEKAIVLNLPARIGSIGKSKKSFLRKYPYILSWSSSDYPFLKSLRYGRIRSEPKNLRKVKEEEIEKILINKQLWTKLSKQAESYIRVKSSGIEGMYFDPVNEDGVVMLFGKFHQKLGFLKIVLVQQPFPDCMAIKVKDKKPALVYIEFEYKSSQFRKHDIKENKSYYVVCWINDWSSPPKNVEIIELRKELIPSQKKLSDFEKSSGKFF